jgi:outer membrane protein assembly factor BamB
MHWANKAVDKLVRLLLLASLIGLGGCTYLDSLMGEEEEIIDPPAVLVDFPASLDVKRIWNRNTGKGTDEQYLMLAPVIDGEKIYVASTDMKVAALNATTGKNLWTHELSIASGGGFWSGGDEVHLTGGPGFGSNMVLIGSSKGDVVASDAETGKEVWVSKLSSEVLSAPQISADGTVVVRTLDGKIYGLSGNNGRRLWSFDQTVPALTLRGTSAPAIDGGMVVAGFDGGRVVALEISSGRVMWETSIATPSGRSELDKMVDIDATPVIRDGIVYVSTFQGQMAALTSNSGRMLWNRDMSSFAGFTLDDTNIYITDSKSVIWALDRLNGTPMWKQEGLLNRQVTAPAIIGNYVVAGDFEGYLHWMDKTTGGFVARQKISGERIIAPPVSANNVIYTFSTDGSLAALTIQ